jgi:hypothetical protein
MPKIAEVAVRLLERTDRGEVSWQSPNPDRNEFVVGIGGLSVSISKFSPHPLSGETDEGVILRILDSKNKQIDYTSTGDNEVEAHKLRELYTKARRHALNVSGQLEELLAELDKA